MYEWFISRRYLRAKHRHGFISLISLISVAGITVGVIALIVVLAIYSGFTDGLRDQILGINSHIIVQNLNGPIKEYTLARDRALTTPDVTGATPYLYAQTLLSGPDGGSGVILRGVDVETAPGVINLPEQMKEGLFSDLNATDGASVPNIILGSELAESLHVRKGDRIRLISPSGPLTPMGVIPKLRTCIISGIFESGMYEYDSSLAYMSIAAVQDFLECGDVVHGLEISVSMERIEKADAIAREVEKKLGQGFIARDWMSMNANLFAAFKLEKIGMFICLTLIILVAALNIISALIMLVMEKVKDIAILKSMGATSASIMRIFFLQGCVIGILGTFLGVLGGLGLCELLSRYKFIELPANVYPMSTLPIKVLPGDVCMIAAATIIITLLATMYPSWRAAKVEPAEALS